MSHPFTMPTIPPELAEIIATHRGLFGGFRMVDEPGPEADQKPEPPKTDPVDDGKGGKPEDPLKEPGLKALQAERDARAKAEADLATLRKQVEDAGKTAEQKAADDLKAAIAKAEGAELRALKYEVAADKGLDLKLAARLTGATKAELEADADALKALVGAKPTPKPDASQGKGGGGAKPTGVGAGRDLYRDTHPTSKTTS